MISFSKFLIVIIIFVTLTILLVTTTSLAEQQQKRESKLPKPIDDDEERELRLFMENKEKPLRQKTCPYKAQFQALLKQLHRQTARSDRDMKRSIEFQQQASEMNVHRVKYSLQHDLRILQHSQEQSIKNWNAGFYIYFIESGQFWKDFSVRFYESVNLYLHEEIDYSGGFWGENNWFFSFQFFKTYEIIKTMFSSLLLICAAFLVHCYFYVDTRQKVNFSREDGDRLVSSERINLILNNSFYFSIQRAKSISVLIISLGLVFQFMIIFAAFWDHWMTIVTYASIAVVLGVSGFIIGVGTSCFSIVGLNLVFPRFWNMLVSDGIFRGLWWSLFGHIKKPVVEQLASGNYFVPNQYRMESESEEGLLRAESMNNFKIVHDELLKRTTTEQKKKE